MLKKSDIQASSQWEFLPEVTVSPLQSPSQNSRGTPRRFTTRLQKKQAQRYPTSHRTSTPISSGALAKKVERESSFACGRRKPYCPSQLQISLCLSGCPLNAVNLVPQSFPFSTRWRNERHRGEKPAASCFNLAARLLPLLLLLILISGCGEPPRSRGPLRQEAYVWQRSWNTNVLEAVRERGPVFDSLVILRSEVTWKDRTPSIVNIPLAYPALKRTGVRIGLALRIGAFSGPFSKTDGRTLTLIDLARNAIQEARSNQCLVSELQLDFDCADSKLDGYKKWVQAFREAIQPVPLTITVLPSWLNESSCKGLLASTDGFVLQVHSLERPKKPDQPFALCEPDQAIQAVEKAGRFGIPFRVALPTYGYTFAFETNGAFVGLSAEGPQLQWRKGLNLREVRTEPAPMAGLVERWTGDRPGEMLGIIWYRLPVDGEKLNWSWATLASVKAGRVPRFLLKAALWMPQANLYEIELINRGDGDYQGPVRLTANWKQARLVASDGWQGFAPVKQGPSQFDLVRTNTVLPAGQRIKAGWLRLDNPSEVTLEHEP